MEADGWAMSSFSTFYFNSKFWIKKKLQLAPSIPPRTNPPKVDVPLNRHLPGLKLCQHSCSGLSEDEDARLHLH